MGGKANSRYAILGALSLGRASGYDVKKRIEGSIAHFWSESYGQIYPALRALAAEGLVEAQSERQPGKPERQVYSLTASGRQALARWLALPARREAARSELLLKLFLGGLVPPEESRGHVERFRETQRARLATYAEIERRLASSRHPHRDYWLITLRYGQTVAAALLRWCDEALEVLAPPRRASARRAARR
jgi:DNA-binding PadR family transcriptional regulator